MKPDIRQVIFGFGITEARQAVQIRGCLLHCQQLNPSRKSEMKMPAGHMRKVCTPNPFSRYQHSHRYLYFSQQEKSFRKQRIAPPSAAGGGVPMKKMSAFFHGYPGGVTK